MNIDFTEKELQVIELMEPGKTAEEICNIVLRDWFKSNSDRMYTSVIKPEDEKLDEIIVDDSVKISSFEGGIL